MDTNLISLVLKTFSDLMLTGINFALFVFFHILFQSRKLKTSYWKVTGIIAKAATFSLSTAWALRWLYFQFEALCLEIEAGMTTVPVYEKTLTPEEGVSLMLINLLFTLLGVILSTNLYWILRSTAKASVKAGLEGEKTREALENACELAIRGGITK